jgi:ABC-type branched-subunit amino acid transport system substrate-binding protein
LVVDGFSTTTTRPIARNFIKIFSERVGSAPSRLDAQAYDAAKIFYNVLEGKGTEMISNRYQLQQALLGVQDFEGVTGNLSFNEQGESQSELHLFQLTKGMIQPTDIETLFENTEGG